MTYRPVDSILANTFVKDPKKAFVWMDGWMERWVKWLQLYE